MVACDKTVATSEQQQLLATALLALARNSIVNWSMHDQKSNDLPHAVVLIIFPFVHKCSTVDLLFSLNFSNWQLSKNLT